LIKVLKNENIERVAHTEVYLFKEPEDESIPLLEWLREMPVKVQAKCTARIDRLGELGHELRRPEADFLRDGIYELRASYQGVHYRMLYFFTGKAVVVVSHGLSKQREVPPKEIAQAIERKKKVEADFTRFTFKPE
jgi:phage-related protein